jgi:hypothetical protein
VSKRPHRVKSGHLHADRRLDHESAFTITGPTIFFFNEKFPVLALLLAANSLKCLEQLPVLLRRELCRKPLNSPADRAQELLLDAEFREIPCIFPCY